MQELTPEGRQFVAELQQRYGVSGDAVMTLLRALVAGHGTMAQFNHPELGGLGQWSQGGMIMIGDMFNNQLKARVDGLCSELAARLRELNPLTAATTQTQSQGGVVTGQGASLFVAGSGGSSGNWWPAELGQPASAGSQNNLRYAYFPAARRLAIQVDGRTTLYDTGDHQIGGVSQQQGGGSSLTFTSQHGTVRLTDLPVVSSAGPTTAASAAPAASTGSSISAAGPTGVAPAAAAPPSTDDVFTKLERLAEMKQKGILSEEEFASAKAELLRRL